DVRDVELRPGRRERALHPGRGIRRQLGRAVQERGGRRESSTAPCPTGGELHLCRHRFVRRSRGVGAVPSTTVGIEDWIGGFSEGRPHVAAIARVRRLVDRGAYEGVRKANARTDLDESGSLGRQTGVRTDAKKLGGAPEQADIAKWLGSRGEEEQLS